LINQRVEYPTGKMGMRPSHCVFSEGIIGEQ